MEGYAHWIPFPSQPEQSTNSHLLLKDTFLWFDFEMSSRGSHLDTESIAGNTILGDCRALGLQGFCSGGRITMGKPLEGTLTSPLGLSSLLSGLALVQIVPSQASTTMDGAAPPQVTPAMAEIAQKPWAKVTSSSLMLFWQSSQES